MAKEWIMVRVPRATHAKLIAISEEFDRVREDGYRSHLEYSDRHGIPIYEVINELVREHREHQRRRGESAERTRKARKQTRDEGQAC